MGFSGELVGKVAIVTGGARGIGRTITDALVASGARVHVFDMTDSNEVGGRAASGECGRRAVGGRRGGAAAEPATLLVNKRRHHARDRSLLKMSDEEWRSVLDVNPICGAFPHCCAPARRA